MLEADDAVDGEFDNAHVIVYTHFKGDPKPTDAHRYELEPGHYYFDGESFQEVAKVES